MWIHVVFLFVTFMLNYASSLGLKPERVALVTGGNKGIGKEIARKLGTENNVHCIIGSREAKLGEVTADELNAEGCNVSFLPLNLDDLSTISAAKSFIEKRYGKLDILVNNAAVCFNDPTLYGRVSHTPFESQAAITINTNFFGTLALTQTMLPLLRNAHSPRIINIASAAGRLAIFKKTKHVEILTSNDLQVENLIDFMNDFITDVEGGKHVERGWPNTCYGVSKAGIIALTRILSRDEPSIMVNSVDPGYCSTDQNNNQGIRPAEHGAITPFLLGTISQERFVSGKHWFDETEIPW